MTVRINRVPIQVDVIQVNKLFQMNLMKDIDYFFQIISLMVKSS